MTIVNKILLLQYLLKKSSIITTITTIIFIVSLIDIQLSNISDNFPKVIKSNSSLITFYIILVVYLISIHILLKISYNIIIKLKVTNIINLIYKITKIFQFTIIILFVILIIQISFFELYTSLILLLIVLISFSLSIFIFIILGYKFFEYIKMKRTKPIFLFLTSSVVLCFNSIFGLVFTVQILLHKPYTIYKNDEIIYPFFTSNSFEYLLGFNYYVFSILSFIVIWLSTLILFFNYSKKIGKKKFWVIVTIPIVYYISQFFVLSIFNYFTYSEQDYILYKIVYTISSSIGGLLFAIPFITFKKILISKNLQEVISIFTIGIILYFVSGSSSIIQTSFPPFGILSISLIGFSSYLFLIGIYLSTRSISNSQEIRKFIYNIIKENKSKNEHQTTMANFLNSLAFVEIENNIKLTIKKIDKKIPNKKEIRFDLSDDEINDYIKDVKTELIKHEGQKKHSN